MGDRFYQQQLQATGNCPGAPYKAKRKRKMAWTDEKKETAVEMYTTENPTPENSMEIVKDIAEKLEESPNGVRTILSKAGVYVKKSPAAVAGSSSTGGGSKRVSKADAIERLTAALEARNVEVDEDITNKLTGKAATYFAEVIEGL